MLEFFGVILGLGNLLVIVILLGSALYVGLIFAAKMLFDKLCERYSLKHETEEK
jgi:hypothetical protein